LNRVITARPHARRSYYSKLGQLSAALLVVLLLAIPGHCENRRWTSADGKSTVEAELVDRDATHVRLRRTNGKIVPVKIASLSKADRDYLATLVPSGDTQAVLRKSLAAKGVRVSGSAVSLVDEAKLKEGLRDAQQVRRKLLLTLKDLAAVEREQENNKRFITKLKQINIQFNTRLATLGPGAGQVRLNNQIVGALNANQTQIQLLSEKDTKIQRTMRAAHRRVNERREIYIEHLLGLRQRANGLQRDYKRLAADKAVTAELEKYGRVSGRKYSLGAARSLKALLRQLKSLEDVVLTDSVTLRRSGNTFFASVMLNGKYAREMVVDSGASLISLPLRLAQECDIKIPESAPVINIKIADGSTIQGRLVTLDKVRVGKFTVENVEAAILGPEAVSAEPLLGMSFLGKFKFELIAQESKLRLVKVETPGDRRKK